MLSKPPAEMHGNSNGRAAAPPAQLVLSRLQADHDDKERGLPISSLFNALRRRWVTALPLGAFVGTLGALIAWAAFQPEFSASAFLRVNADDRRLLFETADMGGRGADFRLYKNTQTQLMKTPFVLSAALRNPEVTALPEIAEQADPMGWLQEKLSVSFPGDGEIMNVSLSTPSSEACVTLVNAVANAFMDEVVVHERNERLQRLDSLERVYAEAESKVRNRRGELKGLATALGTGDTDSLTVAQQSALQQFGLMQEKLSDIQFELLKAEGDLKIAESLNARLLAANEGDPREAQLEPLDERTDSVIRLEDEIAGLEGRLSMVLASVGSRHPTVQRMQGEIEVKRSLLEKHRLDARRSAELMAEQRLTGGKSNSRLASPNGSSQVYDLMGLTSRIEVLKNQEKILQSKVEELSSETRQLGRSSIDIELMRSEITGLEEVLQRVGGEIERTSIELKTSSRIDLLSPAEKATPPNRMKRLLRSVALGLFGFFAPLGLLIVWDLSRKQVDNVEIVNQTLSLATLGTVPTVSRDPMRRHHAKLSQRGQREQIELTEAFDAIASLVIHRATTEQRRVFMISSAVASEGKSTVSCLLAKSLAAAGKKVVLVDFDLRRPVVHQYLELEKSPGVADVLFGRESWANAVQPMGPHNLHVMVAGGREGLLSERLTSGAVEQLFNNLRSAYEFVIVDSCPVLPVVDSRIVGQFSDGVILTLIRDVSRLPTAVKACEILKSYGISVLGTVVIGGRSVAYPNYYYEPKKRVHPALRLTEKT